MPFIENTPESLLRRSDSLEPYTTCHGVTSGGRPCRRGLVESELPSSRRKSKRFGNPNDSRFYCWQHKEQAEQRATAASSASPFSGNRRRRSSIDTLTERLNLTSIGTYSKPQQRSSFKLCCCFSIPLFPRIDEEDDINLPPRPAKANGGGGRISRRHNPIPSHVTADTRERLTEEIDKSISKDDDPGYIYMFWLMPEGEAKKSTTSGSSSKQSPPLRPQILGQSLFGKDGRPPSAGDMVSYFANQAMDMLDNWSDDEDDVPNTSGTRKRDAKSAREHRAKGKREGKKTILLKIGRATNVQRRLNEWKRQCGYDLSLVRYYPWIPSEDMGVVKPRKMPHSHKVERLIHLELEGDGLRVLDADKCKACGREHKEWFEVEASRGAIRKVDDVIKRWVEWDETVGKGRR